MHISNDALQVGADFRDALSQHLDALVARDLWSFVTTLDEDVVNIGPRGERTIGKNAVAAAHAVWFTSPNSWTFEYSLLQLRRSSSAGLALLDVRYRDGASEPEQRFFLSLVFERHDDERWLLVYDQNTPIV